MFNARLNLKKAPYYVCRKFFPLRDIIPPAPFKKGGKYKECWKNPPLPKGDLGSTVRFDFFRG
jgi:hypothetical protein